jgi:hypothetical protein
MKAKEWAAKLAEAPDSRDETLKAFVEEIGTVAQQRGGSASAVEGAIREQRAKWQPFAGRNPRILLGSSHLSQSSRSWRCSFDARCC